MSDNTTKIKIAHLIKDDKFFETNAIFFDKLAKVENNYYLYSRGNIKAFKHIKSKQKVALFTNYFKYINNIRKNDVVIIHSFLSLDYLTLLFTSSHQIVIWKEWGYDIYDELNGMPPLVNINLYKPITNNYIRCNKKQSVLLQTKKLIFGSILSCIRRIGFSNIDYMTPCIPMDYKLVKEQCPYFRANTFPGGLNQFETHFIYKEKVGNILVGNSLTYTNNHLDVFERLYDIIPSREIKCIVPLNYGTAYNKGADLIKLSRFKEDQVIWLHSFLDRKGYFKLISSVTHAVFGVIRQQALGNIYYCLRTGVKVYLYDESIVSKQLRHDGYIIYSIDSELTAESLSEPLSKEQALHNYNLWTQRYVGTSVADIQKALIDAVDNVKS